MDSISDKCMNLVSLFVKEIPNYLISLLFINNTFFMPGVRVLVAQSRLTLCDPVDCSPLGSSVPVVFQARYWSGQSLPSLTQRMNPGLLHCWQILYHLSQQGRPLETKTLHKKPWPIKYHDSTCLKEQGQAFQNQSAELATPPSRNTPWQGNALGRHMHSFCLQQEHNGLALSLCAFCVNSQYFIFTENSSQNHESLFSQLYFCFFFFSSV